jgi:hypothetical protein
MTYKADKFRYVKREKVGVVGVDSGQLIIMDPCYIDSEVAGYGSKVLGVDFWGQGKEEVEKRLEDEGIWVSNEIGSKGRIELGGSKLSVQVLTEKIYAISKEIDKVIVVAPFTDSFYDAVSDITLDQDAGQLPYRMGHPGLAVAFSSGLGDGVYDVYVTSAEVPGWGRRNVKVEIELISEADFEDTEICEACGEHHDECACDLLEDDNDEEDQ